MRLITGLAEAVERVKLNANVDGEVDRVGSGAGAGLMDIGTDGKGEVRRGEAKTASDVLAENLAREVKGEQRVDAGGRVDLAGDGRSDALELSVEAGRALANGNGLAVGKVELGADDAGDAAGNVRDGNDNVERDFGRNGDNVGNLELGERELDDLDALGQVRRLDGGRGRHGHGQADVDVVGRHGRGGEAVLCGDGDVGLEAAVGATVGAVDGEVRGANVGVVKVLVEDVLEADLGLFAVAEAAAELLRLDVAANVDAGVGDKVVPLGRGLHRQPGDARGGVVGHGADVVRLAAVLAAAAGRVGDVDEGVGVLLANPRPRLLGVGDGRGAVELHLDLLGVGAVHGADKVSKVVLVEQTVGRLGRDRHVGKEL